MARPGVVCVKCNKEMKPEKTGELVLEMAVFGPYKIWSGDKVKCPKCGMEVVTGWGQNPLSAHYQEGFEKEAAKCKVKF